MAAAPKTVLLVDDDITLSDMYAERLRASGYTVLVAHDGEAGLVEAKKKPDIILLDIMMPKINGLDTLKELKANPETANIPVVMLTALIQELDKVKGIAGGAVSYFVKSEVMPGELIKQVQAILGGQSPANGAAQPAASAGTAAANPKTNSAAPPSTPIQPNQKKTE